MKIICVSFYQTIFADGKFHVVPSGDLHVLRANLPADAATPYLCRVRNTLTGREENSPPYNLIIDGKCDFFYNFFFYNISFKIGIRPKIISFH